VSILFTGGFDLKHPDERARMSSSSASTITDVVLRTRDLSVFYGDFCAVRDVTIEIPRGEITAFIGPSGCGKSTVLRCFNRMNDLIPTARVHGAVEYHDIDLYRSDADASEVRRRIGMVFQKANPFPKSIFDNVAYGPRVNGLHKKGDLEAVVEKSLRGAALWDEVKDRLDSSAMGLSGGQQQRLCIARSIAIEPDVLLMDEPCSALDPIATAKIEELIAELKQDYTVLIVTHNMQQAARCSDHTAYMYLGELIEFGETDQIFIKPKQKATEDYITGRFG